MKRAGKLVLATVALSATVAMAYDVIWVDMNDGLHFGVSPSDVRDIRLSADRNYVEITGTPRSSDETVSLPFDRFEEITFGQSEGTVEISFLTDGTVDILNPLAFDGVAASVDGQKVTINSEANAGINITVNGATDDGCVKVYASEPVTLTLANAKITNTSGSALNFQTTAPITVRVVGDCSLTDGEKYTATPADEAEKGTIHCESDLVMVGDGTVTIAGRKKHAINCGGSVTQSGTNIVIPSANTDGIHCEGFAINDGSITCTPTDDAIDAGSGDILIGGGRLDFTLNTTDTKGLKTDADVVVTGGSARFNLVGDLIKGIKPKGVFTMSGGELEFIASGNAVVTDGEPSYCTAIKSGSDANITGGSITLRHTGKVVKEFPLMETPLYRAVILTWTVAAMGQFTPLPAIPTIPIALPALPLTASWPLQVAISRSIMLARLASASRPMALWRWVLKMEQVPPSWPPPRVNGFPRAAVLLRVAGVDPVHAPVAEAVLIPKPTMPTPR